MTDDLGRHIRERYPPGQPVERLDGQDTRALFFAAYAWLERNYEIVNRMNVFPVPDGDTGTNMLLTIKRAWEEIAEESSDHVGHIVGRLAHGALMGARGNSGVIFSQILRGMARTLKEASHLCTQNLADALHEGSKTAYRGVSRPVEGTILTVAREAAQAARAAAHLDNDLRFLFERTLQAAQQALANTPNLLPVLKQAGVVDSGGMGFCLIWEGMTRCLRGEVIVPGTAEVAAAEVDVSGMADQWGYDVQYLVYADGVTEEQVRHGLEALGGESIVVGMADGVVKVHVHGPDPGPFLSYGASLGHLDDVVVENMTLQTLERKGEFQPPAGPSRSWREGTPAPSYALPSSLVAETQPLSRVGIVAVSPGPGFDEILRGLGVQAVVPGGQTMNPSTADILKVVEQVPQDEVLILPNNKNVIMAAEQAAQMSHKKVRVVPTHSLPQAVSAMLAFDPEGDLDRNFESMTATLGNVRSGQVTVAISAARFDGIEVQKGDIIGLAEGDLVTKGADVTEVVLDLLRHLEAEKGEIITLYYGDNIEQDEAEALADRVRQAFPDQEVEVVYGGQPHYPYIVSVE